jgi:acyl carrier protein
MKIGRAYKLAALAADHKVRAMVFLENGDHTGAKREEIAYLDRLNDIPSGFRHELAPFLDACLQAKFGAIDQEARTVADSHKQSTQTNLQALAFDAMPSDERDTEFSNTLADLQAIVLKHFGIPLTAFDFDSSFPSVGIDSPNLDELIDLIEARYEIDMSLKIAEHCNFDMPDEDVHQLTLRQLSRLVDQLR